MITLQSILEGKHDTEIEEKLEQHNVPSSRWWSSLYKVVEGKSLAHALLVKCLLEQRLLWSVVLILLLKC